MMTESLGLRLSGDIYNRDFISFDGAFEIGLDQDRFRENIDDFSRTDSDNGLLLSYDFSLDALPDKPVSFSAYARRDRDRRPRRFLPSLLEDRREAGGTIFARDGVWTGEFGVNGSDIERTGNRDEADDERLRRLRFFADNRWEFSDRHALRIMADHEREESQYQGDTYHYDNERTEARLEHDLAFGAAGEHRINTFLRYNNERGDLARDEYEFVPRLTLEHNDKLTTSYRYQFYGFDEGAIDLYRHKLDASAVYRPTEPWRITGDAFWLTERVADDIETYEFGGSVDVQYARPTSLGELSANLTLAAQRTRTTGSAGERIVRDERQQFDRGRLLFLSESNVIRASIVAHDVNRTRIFVEGVDYNVVAIGRRISISRIPTGRIGDTDVVYFDYRYRVAAGSRVDSYRVDFEIEHAFDLGLTPYYTFEIRREFTNGSNALSVFEDNTERHRFGVRYERPTWSVTGEAEIFNDTYEPYYAFHGTCQAALLRHDPHNVDALVHASQYRFTDDLNRRRVTWIDLDLTDRMRVTRYLSATLGAAYRWEDDSIDGETNALDLSCGLQLVRGQLDVHLTAEYDLLDIGESEDRDYGVWLRVRRNLTHLLPQSRGLR
jgi:hypothetical protein